MRPTTGQQRCCGNYCALSELTVYVSLAISNTSIVLRVLRFRRDVRDVLKCGLAYTQLHWYQFCESLSCLQAYDFGVTGSYAIKQVKQVP